MLFNSTLFGIFFFIFFVVFHFWTIRTSAKVWLLICGSLLFYATWNPYYLPLLIGTAFVDFFSAKKISTSLTSRAKKLWLILSLTQNIGVLFVFKASFLWREGGWLMPIGLSFYTFQSMAYVIDVYRGSLKAQSNPREFFAAVSFFPHLIAGPLIRAQLLLTQFQKIPALTFDSVHLGFWWISLGLVKKTIADMLSPILSRVFENGATDMASNLGAMLGYFAQMYGDFSGYTDIALGCALLLGIHLPRNFYLPFTALSPMKYYREHWHITLSAWITDYVYAPLAVFLARRNLKLIPIALFITMIVMGLWHGFGWNFVLFGIYLALLFFLESRITQFNFKSTALIKIWKVIGPLTVCYLVACGLLLFRSNSPQQAATVWMRSHGFFNSDRSEWTYLAIALFSILIFHGLSLLTDRKLPKNHLIIWLVIILGFTFSFTFGGTGKNFIYFQF